MPRANLRTLSNFEEIQVSTAPAPGVMQDLMKTMTEYKQNIKPIKRPASIVFMLVFDFIILYLTKYELFESKNLIFLLLAIIGTGIFVLKPFVTNLELRITDKNLIITNRIFNFNILTKNFLLREMTGINVKKNINENTYWGGNGIRIYDKTPIVLTFQINNKNIIVGKSYQIDDIEKIITELKRRQKTANPA
jgi:hypothetical protein